MIETETLKTLVNTLRSIMHGNNVVEISRKEFIAAAADNGLNENYCYFVLKPAAKGTKRGTYDVQAMFDIANAGLTKRSEKETLKDHLEKTGKTTFKRKEILEIADEMEVPHGHVWKLLRTMHNVSRGCYSFSSEASATPLSALSPANAAPKVKAKVEGGSIVVEGAEGFEAVADSSEEDFRADPENKYEEDEEIHEFNAIEPSDEDIADELSLMATF